MNKLRRLNVSWIVCKVKCPKCEHWIVTSRLRKGMVIKCRKCNSEYVVTRENRRVRLIPK